MSPYIVTITPSPMSRIFPTVCGQNPRWRRMLLCSRSTPFQPVHRRLPRPATRRLRTSGRGRRSKTGTEVYPKVRGITIGTSTAIEQSGRPPETIIQVPPQTLPSTEVCAPERSQNHSSYQLKPIHMCEVESSGIIKCYPLPTSILDIFLKRATPSKHPRREDVRRPHRDLRGRTALHIVLNSPYVSWYA